MSDAPSRRWLGLSACKMSSRDQKAKAYGTRRDRAAETDGGSCSACFTASMSPRRRAERGGGGSSLGGGGSGPAVACTPGW